MPNNRIDAVVSAIVDGIRQAAKDQDISFEEYRTGIGYIMKTAQAGELPLLIDLFMNATIVGNINAKNTAVTSPSDMEGPYFLDDVPAIANGGKLNVLDDDTCEPLVLRGTVRDTEGNPLPGVSVFVWSSTHDGKYGGIHDDLPNDLYRGKLTTDANGRYEVESRCPVPYTIPNSGPVGALLEMMGRHTWRPAHVHYKLRHDGFQELITQAYFEGGDYVDDDCCEGIVPPEFVKPYVKENGKVIFDVDFTIQRVAAPIAA